MSKPFEKLKKLKGRSWSEIFTRGEQVISGYSEQIGIGGKVPSDSELFGLLDRKRFSTKKPTNEEMLTQFYDDSSKSFFRSVSEKREIIETYRAICGNEAIDAGKEKYPILETADRILEGKFDLLGYENLYFGTEIDWHFEPISGKTSPKKHWKLFDELDTQETGDKKIVWEINRHQHFFTLGVAFWLTGDERYASTFVRHVESWMQQNPPGIGVNWLSSLEVAFRTISWIWAIHFFRDSSSFSPELYKQMSKYLYLFGKHIEKNLSTYYSPNTHLTGEALALYYLGTQLNGFQKSSHWRTLGNDILIAELDRQILADGVYFEQSTWYQRYTADFYTQFLQLRSLNGEKTETNLQAKINSKVQLSIDFLMHLTRPDGTTPIIGDDDGGFALPVSNRLPNDFRSTLAAGSILFNRGDYKFVAGEFSEDSLWLFGTRGMQKFNNMRLFRPKETSKAFPVGGYFVMRDGWSETDNFVVLDCGPHGSMNCGHSHADALAIDVAIGGKTVLVDPGTYTYHESIEWRDFFRSTMAHNALSIDNKSSSEPGGKFGWNSVAVSAPRTWISEDRFDYFGGLQNGYERLEEGSSLQHRNILFLRNDYCIIRDYVDSLGSHSYQMNFHFDSDTKPEIEGTENGTWCVSELPGKDSGMRLFAFGDNGHWQKKESWVSPIYGRKINAPFLRYVSEGVGSQEFFTFLLPSDKAFKSPEVVETQVPGGRAFVINYQSYQDIFLFADNDAIIRTELFDSDFRFTWARISDGETEPEEYVMIGGRNFSVNGREIIKYPQRLKFATARRLGNKLNVRTNENVFSVLLPSK